MDYRRIVKEFIALCLVWSGIVTVLRLALWRDRVLILVYHNPTPEAMDSHLSHLRRIADPIRFADIGAPSNGRPRFVVTLDDGHAGNRALRDVFRFHNVKPTIFVCSQIIGTKRQFWWQFSNEIAKRSEKLKRKDNRDRLSTIYNLGFSQEAESEYANALSKEDIEAMKPFCDFQSHGRFHPILTRCDDEECDYEITQSRHEVEDLIGADCTCFAYPNGNYGAREIGFLSSAGYLTGRTLDLGWNDATTDPFRLKAVVVSDDSSTAWFRVQMSMIAPYFRYLRRGSWFGRFKQF
jgi:peptidoglycan/xylan/chitin deacetylase (PgdA/CDA1 family)